MQIKHAALANHLQKHTAPLYILVGQDHYLLDDAFYKISDSIKKKYGCEPAKLPLENSEDWAFLYAEATSYSLFSEKNLIQATYDKKTLDAAGKKVLTAYVDEADSSSFIIIKAPSLPLKQVQSLVNHEKVVVVLAYPLSADALKQWIFSALKQKNLQFEREVPELIHQYTQGNMLACAQWVEKLSLSFDATETITTQALLEQLSNQCDHAAFELIDACLLGQADKAVQILRHASTNKTESVLMLWMLTQEIRILLALLEASQKQQDIKSVAASLKVWPQRLTLYKARLQIHKVSVLKQLLQYCLLIDEQIKSTFSTQVWNSLEILALSLCKGEFLGDRYLGGL